jgi:glycosyltransferase involved in cell wall biosynthesis
MIKVLHAVEAFSGGIVQSIATLCRALDGEVTFHILHGRRPDAPEDAQAQFPQSVTFLSWPSAGREIAPGRDGRAILELRAAAARIRPDLIHAHSSKAGALARLAFPSGGIPVVYSPRGYAFLRRDKGPVGRAAFWMIERLLGTLPHVTVGCGLGEYGLARGVSGRAVLIPNMINPADFAEAAPLRPHSDGPLRIAMAGGIRPQKNFPLFREIADAVRDRDWHFLWIGDGTVPGGRAVPPNVEITGWLRRAEVLRAMAGCHVFMQTSLWEGLPIALLEGMALGLAVLARPAVGNTELVVEGFNGFLCLEAASFVAALHRLDSNRDALAAMGAASCRLVGQHHVAECIAPRWLSLYRHYVRYRRYG